MTFYSVLIAAVLIPVAGAARDQDAICETLSLELVEKMSAPPLSRDYRLYNVYAFYSGRLDSCIHVETKLIGAEVFIRDLTRTVIRDYDAIYPPALLHCDVSGVDQVDIDSVRKYRGFVAVVPYKEWLTDGQGGPPRVLKTPDEPLDRMACKGALDRWLVTWRQ